MIILLVSMIIIITVQGGLGIMYGQHTRGENTLRFVAKSRSASAVMPRVERERTRWQMFGVSSSLNYPRELPQELKGKGLGIRCLEQAAHLINPESYPKS